MTIQVNPILSPREITIPEVDGEEITVQTLINQIRDWEDEQGNLCYPSLASASGKDNLGGGVLVGITVRLLNSILKFAARAAPTICSVTGGNLVAVDGNGDPMYPLGYTTNIMATITASSSATLQESEAIEYASFEGTVCINVATGSSTTAFPSGTHQQPVNSLALAKTIAMDRGVMALYVEGALTLASGDDISGYTIKGQGATFNFAYSTITMASGCITSNTTFRDLLLQGVQGGEIEALNCVIKDVSNTHCSFRECGFNGTQTLKAAISSTHTRDSHLCWTNINGSIIDYNGSPMRVSYHAFSGVLTIKNCTNAAANIEIQLISDKIILDSTCTAGNFTIRGVGELVNNSTMTVNKEGLVTSQKSGKGFSL